MLFGGSHEGRDITTEEGFEIAKGEFTTHFNEKHQDIMSKREKPKNKKFKKIEEETYNFPTLSLNMPVGSLYFGRSLMYGFAEAPSREPEYDVINVNINNLDRNARFQARLRQ